MQVLREMLSGFKFSLRLETIRVQLHTTSFKIRREHKELPFIEFELAILAVLAAIINANV